MSFSTCTYVFESVFAELAQKMQESEEGKPRAPQQHLVHVLDVDDAENENEFVENEIPKFIFEVLLFGHSQFPEHQFLDGGAEEDQQTEGHVDHRL